MIRTQTDTPYEVLQDVWYKCIGYHRGTPTQQKSVWTISLSDEINTFSHAYISGWLHIKTKNNYNEASAWGMHFSRRFSKLGTGTRPERKELHVSKFVCSDTSLEWHGYPVDCTCIKWRVPDPILRKWKSAGIIDTKQMVQMKRGHNFL